MVTDVPLWPMVFVATDKWLRVSPQRATAPPLPTDVIGTARDAGAGIRGNGAGVRGPGAGVRGPDAGIQGPGAGVRGFGAGI